MMDITAILHMHAELESDSRFILMFLLDLFFTGSTTSHWLRYGMYPADHSTLSKPIWPEEVTLFGGMYHSTPMASVLTIGTILVFFCKQTLG